jgi:hypothetical protein
VTEQPIIVVRASAWPTLFDCAHRFYWQNIYGLRSPSSGRAALGTAIHAGTAVYDTAVMEGKEARVIDAVDASREALAQPNEEVAWDPEDLPRSEADTFAIRLTTKYCQEISPTRRYVGIELQCESLDIATRHGVVRVTGKTDRVRELEDGRRGISDIKTGKTATSRNDDGTRRANTREHYMQTGIYTLMAEQATQERMEAPAEIIGLQTTKEAPVATGEIADATGPLLGTDESPGLIEMAASMAKSGTFPPNPKSMLCSRKYCAAYAYHCKFRGEA